MKRFAIAAAAVTALAAGTAQAGIVVTPIRTPFDATWDRVDFKITAFDGADTPASAVNGIEGTFTASPGGGIALAGTAANWRSQATNNGSAPDPRSYVNFDSTAGNLARTGTGPFFESLFGTWFTTTAELRLRPVDPDPVDGFDQTLLGTFFIRAGTDVSYTGRVGTTVGGDQALSFSTGVVPEPATLTLVALAGMGLLARRRKA